MEVFFCKYVLWSSFCVNKEIYLCLFRPKLSLHLLWAHAAFAELWFPLALGSRGWRRLGVLARPPRGQGVPVHRGGPTYGGHGTGHQRGSWAAGEWCPQQQSCQQQRVSSEATDPCSDAIEAARKPPASLPAGGKEKGLVGQEPGSGRKGAVCQLIP